MEMGLCAAISFNVITEDVSNCIFLIECETVFIKYRNLEYTGLHKIYVDRKYIICLLHSFANICLALYQPVICSELQGIYLGNMQC